MRLGDKRRLLKIIEAFISFEFEFYFKEAHLNERQVV